MGRAFPLTRADRSNSASMSPSSSPTRYKPVMTLEQKRIKRKLIKAIDTDSGNGVARQIREGVDLPVPRTLLTEVSLEDEV